MTSNINRIEFLDVSIHKDDTGMITSSLYRKPTAGNGILHASSFHPKNLIRSIPFGQYLRVRWNCSDESTFKREADNLRTRLLARGYSNKCLKKAFKKATSQTRQQLNHQKAMIIRSGSLPIFQTGTFKKNHQQILACSGLGSHSWIHSFGTSDFHLSQSQFTKRQTCLQRI